MSDNSKQTIIEEGTEFDGTVRSECPITLSGTLKGELDAPALRVTGSGSVQGKVKVMQLVSDGAVAGEIDAETVELSGSVNDQTVIRAKNLEVKLSQSSGAVEVSFGNCELEVGEKRAETAQSAGSESTAATKKKKKSTASSAETEPEQEMDIVDAVTSLID